MKVGLKRRSMIGTAGAVGEGRDEDSGLLRGGRRAGRLSAFLVAGLFLVALSAGAQERPGAFLGELTWPEARDRVATAPVVVLPFGAGAKEHGPHLPMNADAVVMDYLCRVAVDSLPVLVAPPILHGWFPAFRGWPGTEVADPAVFQAYVMKVAESLVENGARRIVILNTGIDRATGLPLSVVAREIRVRTGTPTLVVSWDALETSEVEAFQEQEAGGHADELETSLHLVLQPDRVRLERAPAPGDSRAQEPIPGYRPGLFARDTADPAYSATGVSGDPTLATEEKGRRLLAIMTRRWLEALRGFSEVPTFGGEPGGPQGPSPVRDRPPS